MKSLEIIYRAFDNLATIIKNTRPLKKVVYFVYLWFIFYILLFLERILHLKITRKKILGHQFYFSSYYWFTAIFQEIFFSQIYDFETDNPYPVILDCGANIGLASLYFKIKYPQSYIICFEPSKTPFCFLKKNLEHFGNIKFVRAGLSNKNESDFLYHFNTLGDINSSIYKNLHKNLKFKKESIQLIKLSDYTKNLKRIDFLKLDIEGAEEKVLLELETEKQLDKINKLFVEFHSNQENSLAKLLSILERNKFKIITSGGVRAPFEVYKDDFYCLLVFAYR